MLRKILFWAHLVTGLMAGLLVLLLCLTGAILSFELQMVDFAERDARARRPAEHAELLSPAQIFAAAQTIEPDKINTVEWFADPAMPVRVMTDKRAVVLLNGYTGEVLGHGAMGLRGFMRWTTALHTNLTTGPVGHLFVAWANVAFVFIIVSGLWIWWPRVWRWKALRNSMALRFDVKGKARDWNWHNAAGFWFLLPLLFIACTGLVLSFRGVDQWWRSFGGSKILGPSQPAMKAEAPAVETPAAWPQWMEHLQQEHPGWRSIMAFGGGLPNKDGVIALAVNGGTARQTPWTMHVRLDARSGCVNEKRGWGSGDGSARARSIARLGHSGEFFGNWGQAFALATCLAGLLRVYTGFALSWRRFFGRKAEPVA